MIFILKTLIDQRWLFCCLLFFLPACQKKNHYSNFTLSTTDSVKLEQDAKSSFDSIQLYKKLIRSGDLILRTGIDFTSETMRLLSSKDKTYSHCGIASIENDSLFVYHAIGGEFNPDQKLRRDPFELFCNPYENRGFGIFRYKLTAVQKEKLINVVHAFYKKGIKFDMQFDLATDDRMYCSEFVYKSIEQAIDHQIILPVTVLSHVKFIATDNLFINPLCSEVKRVVFTSP
jgi:hypothetical protein